jgi:hypothetical protein
MSTIKSFDTFINEGLTNQYLTPVNEGLENESYTYRTEASNLRPMLYFDQVTTALQTGTLNKGNIPGWLKRYGNFEGKSADQIYQSLITNAALTEIDSIITAKAQASGTAEELAKWKADPTKNLLYAMILLDLNSNNRDYQRGWLDKGRSSVVVSSVETKAKVKTNPSTATADPSQPKPNSVSIPFQFAKDGSKGDVFVVNEWILSEEFKSSINEIINGIKETISTLTPPEGKPKAFCPTITINSSCSTAPNGTPKSSPNASKYAGKTISFMDLSTERANAVSTYLKTKLAEVGVLIDADTKVTINAAGQNGDGTSGPAWNEVEGVNNAEKLAKVKQYQMAEINFEVMFNTSTTTLTPSKENKPETETIPAEVLDVKSGEYKLMISIKTFRIHLPELHMPRLPRINIRLPKIRIGKPNYMKCPKW